MFKTYLLPAIIFQITILAGGYGTGQEFVQFFLVHGPIEGLLGLMVAAACWSLVCMLSFNSARKWQSYDYRAFFKKLLGDKHWYIFEFSYLALMFIVLSVVAASVGNLGQIMLGTPYNFNIAMLVVGVTIHNILDSKFIERTFTATSFIIIATYATFSILCFKNFHTEIAQQLNYSSISSSWFMAGVQYAGYNLGLVPAVFFALRSIKTQKQALISGAITGVWAIIPGVMFYLAMLAKYPAIMQAPIPSVYLLESLQAPVLTWVFSIVLFVTLIQTAISLIHSLNQRIEADLIERKRAFPRHHRVAIGLGIIISAMLMAQLGLQGLIKHGYGILTWVIIAIYVVPLLYVYLRRIGNNIVDVPTP